MKGFENVLDEVERARASGFNADQVIEGLAHTVKAYFDLCETSGAERTKALLMKNYQLTLSQTFLDAREVPTKQENENESVVLSFDQRQ